VKGHWIWRTYAMCAVPTPTAPECLRSVCRAVPPPSSFFKVICWTAYPLAQLHTRVAPAACSNTCIVAPPPPWQVATVRGKTACEAYC
jgi:hypothetical protein